MAATLVASVPQRPVQFSFLPFPVLPLPLPLPSFPRVGGSNIDSDISTGILFFFPFHPPPRLPPSSAPSLYFSLSGGQDARHATLTHLLSKRDTIRPRESAAASSSSSPPPPPFPRSSWIFEIYSKYIINKIFLISHEVNSNLEG